MGSATYRWGPFVIFLIFFLSFLIHPSPTAARTTAPGCSTAAVVPSASTTATRLRHVLPRGSRARLRATTPARLAAPPGASSATVAGPAPELARDLRTAHRGRSSPGPGTTVQGVELMLLWPLARAGARTGRARRRQGRSLCSRGRESLLPRLRQLR